MVSTESPPARWRRRPGPQGGAQKIATVSIAPPLVPDTAHPDIDTIQAAIADAIDRSKGDLEKSDQPVKKKREAGRPARHRRLGRLLKSGYVANDTEDVAAAC